jgi:hypothetical protein
MPDTGASRPCGSWREPSKRRDGFARRRRRARPPADDTRRCSRAGAFAAAADRDDETLASWVGDFLASRGSDKAVFAAALAQDRHWWLGPLHVPVVELVRLAGPGDEARYPIEPEKWEGMDADLVRRPA